MPKSFLVKTDRLMRSLHLYTGLFLVPWMLVYGTSAVCLNHNERVRSLFGVVPPRWEKVREVEFTPDGSFPSAPAGRAEAILHKVDLSGPHRIQGEPTGDQMLIFRICATGNYRVTWRPRRQIILVEQQRPFSFFRLINYLHFRGGYGMADPAMIAWAVIVDAVALSIWLWVISGVYLWARRPKRRLGGAVLAAGIVLFAVLVAMLCR